jgi:hypothetical protein
VHTTMPSHWMTWVLINFLLGAASNCNLPHLHCSNSCDYRLKPSRSTIFTHTHTHTHILSLPHQSPWHWTSLWETSVCCLNHPVYCSCYSIQNQDRQRISLLLKTYDKWNNFSSCPLEADVHHNNRLLCVGCFSRHCRANKASRNMVPFYKIVSELQQILMYSLCRIKKKNKQWKSQNCVASFLSMPKYTF